MTGHAGLYEYVDPAVLDPVLVVLAKYLVLAVPLVLVALWFTGRPGKLDGLVVFAAAVAAIAISYGLGLLYSHPPPSQLRPDTLLTAGSKNAFPSQHAAAAFGMVAPLWARGRRRLAVTFLGIAVLVGLGRVATGLHHPVDILGGVVAAVLGFGLVWVGMAPVERGAEFVIAVEARVLGFVRRLVR